MPGTNYPSWGRYPTAAHTSIPLNFVPDLLPSPNLPVLARGLGRSYGDACLNDGGVLLLCEGLDRVVHFDIQNGVLEAEAGMSLQQVLQLILPQQWFLSVTPGTQFVTLGGAVANDVHGKNHHGAGSFGNHLLGIELLRSDGTRRWIGPQQDPLLFQATIAGMGLTGLICRVRLKLQKVQGPWFDSRAVHFRNLEEYFRLTPGLTGEFAYTAAWIDCLARGSSLGRGIYFCGNHSAKSDPLELKKGPTVPCDLPGWLLNNWSIRAFNFVYNRQKGGESCKDYRSFLYPLDVLNNWNRIYGRRGFLQWQCVVPPENSEAVVRELLKRISHSGLGSFLALLKTFGNMQPLGMMSFARPGVTLALDFPMLGKKTLDLLSDLDALVHQAGGAQYAAKDARMAPEDFQAGYGRLSEFCTQLDPAFSSGFWRRAGRALP